MGHCVVERLGLRDAVTQPYVYDALLTFAQKPIPYGEGFDAWRRDKAAAMEEGKEFPFLGRECE